MKRVESLRRRLIRWLLLPLLVLALAGAWQDYRSALARAKQHQDVALSRIASVLAARLDVDADDAPDDDISVHLQRTLDLIQRTDGVDRLDFAVVDRSGHRVGGSAQVLSQASAMIRKAKAYTADDAPLFDDLRLPGAELRAVLLPYAGRAGSGQVVVMETTRGRDEESRQILLSTLAVNGVWVVVTLLLVWFGVRLGMRPLDALGDQVAARAPDDLSLVPHTAWPRELQPLVSALNRLLTNLQEVSAVEQAFLSNAAHQLRTPLAGVLTQLELLADDVDNPARLRLQAACDALHRLARSTHQMLALARAAPQASQSSAYRPLDLPWLLEECASQWLDSAVAQGVELAFEPGPARVRSASVWMLHELLGNLVHNALRHSPPGTEVTVRCGTAEDTSPWLEVEDQGPGVPEGERLRIFERFYRVSGSPPGGAGLGLAIVREVADRHHAQIELGPGRAGRGLRVRIVFPAEAWSDTQQL